jgi:hypothetical protein
VREVTLVPVELGASETTSASGPGLEGTVGEAKRAAPLMVVHCRQGINLVGLAGPSTEDVVMIKEPEANWRVMTPTDRCRRINGLSSLTAKQKVYKIDFWHS